MVEAHQGGSWIYKSSDFRAAAMIHTYQCCTVSKKEDNYKVALMDKPETLAWISEHPEISHGYVPFGPVHISFKLSSTEFAQHVQKWLPGW